MERVRVVGLGHRGGQLRHLQEPHHGPVHRVPGQPGQRHQRGVHSGLGDVQPRLPLPLHLQVAQDQERLPPVQPGLGVPKVWTIKQNVILLYTVVKLTIAIVKKKELHLDHKSEFTYKSNDMQVILCC